MARVFGLFFSDFSVRLFGCALALYVGITAYGFITDAFAKADAAFEQIHNATEGKR